MIINKVGYLDSEKLQGEIIENLDITITLTVEEYFKMLKIIMKNGEIKIQ
jgi:hypothetical protein